jgi:pimeloyl-ACP methyl ester carboxylesterase
VQELYRLYPELVATLILIGAYAGWTGSLPPHDVAVRVKGVQAMLAAPAKELGPRVTGLFAAEPSAEFAPLLEEIATDVRPKSLETQLFAMAGADERDLLPGIAVPTLLIWGELDTRSTLSIARQFERAIPDTKLVVIPEAGHVCHLEQPDQVNEAVRGFCRAHSPRPA